MDYINKTFDRVDPAKLSFFLLYGTENHSPTLPYQQWTERAHDDLTAQLCRSIPDENERENILTAIYLYTSSAETLAMELGLKSGARLILSLLQNQSGSCTI